MATVAMDNDGDDDDDDDEDGDDCGDVNEDDNDEVEGLADSPPIVELLELLPATIVLLLLLLLILIIVVVLMLAAAAALSLLDSLLRRAVADFGASRPKLHDSFPPPPAVFAAPDAITLPSTAVPRNAASRSHSRGASDVRGLPARAVVLRDASSLTVDP